MDNVPNYMTKDVLILGCGNVLFGDDGFGPAVTDYINENFKIPENALVLDAGTSVRQILFNIILSEKKPRLLVIIDAVDCRMEPGAVFELTPEDLPLNKRDDFSMHHIPSSNMLSELSREGELSVRIIACQVQNIPDSVKPGLSKIVEEAIPLAAVMAMGMLGKV